MSDGCSLKDVIPTGALQAGSACLMGTQENPFRAEDDTAAQPQPWLGLDVGTRRIGVALSNALGIAQPLLTIERSQPRRDQRSILRLARRHGCAGIVVGNPLHLSGDSSRQTERVHRFVDELKALIAQPPDQGPPDQEPPDQGEENASAAGRTSLIVHLWDERLSTVEAHAALEATGHNSASHHPSSRGRRSGIRSGIVDQLAAALILQGWLDAQSGRVTLLPPEP